MIRNLIHALSVRSAKRLANAGVIWPFAYFLGRRLAATTLINSTHGQQKQYTLLALSSERFRNDLRLLEESGRLRVLRLPINWQRGLLGLFWEGRVETSINMNYEYLRDDIPDWIKHRRSAARRFLRALFMRLISKFGVDAVISAAIWYPQDYDWGYAAEQAGIPYIALHKENLASGAGHRAFMDTVARKVGRFFGSRLIVHNEVMRQVFIKSGIIDPDSIKALGAMRMDQFVSLVSNRPPAKISKSRKQVLFFSFERAPQLWGLHKAFPDNRDAGMPNLFRNSHAAIGRLAQMRPDIDFVIKMKWAGIWEQEIIRALQEAGIEHEQLPNLNILANADAHQLILESDVICAYGSTTLLEASITGTPIIMPCFAEAEDSPCRDFVQFYGRDDLFDIAASPDELEKKVLHYLDDPTLGPGRLDACRAEFEKYVSPLEGGSRAAYVGAIIEAIESRKKTAPPSSDSAAKMAAEPV